MLILTNNRLVCAKIEKGGKVLAVRAEWAIPKVTTGKVKPSGEKPKLDKEKEKKKGKDSVNQTILSVDPKGDNEFVVLTVRQTPLILTNTDPSCFRQTTKSFSFRAENSALRSNWVSKIQRELDPAAVSSAAA